jgi:hypothetical protein
MQSVRGGDLEAEWWRRAPRRIGRAAQVGLLHRRCAAGWRRHRCTKIRSWNTRVIAGLQLVKVAQGGCPWSPLVLL